MFKLLLHLPYLLVVFDLNKVICDRVYNIETAFGLLNSYMSRDMISNNVVCATSKGSDQPAHTRSLIRAFASRLKIL